MELIKIYATRNNKNEEIKDYGGMYRNITQKYNLTTREKLDMYHKFINNVAYPNYNILFKNIKNKGPKYITEYDRVYEENLKEGYDSETLYPYFPYYPLKKI